TIGILMVPLQTTAEELIFRGYLMQAFARWAKNRWVPLVVTSFVFGLMHISNPEIEKIGYILLIYYIGTGFFLGIMTLMDEGTELAIGFHAANNLVGALLITSDWSAFQTPSVFKDVSDPTKLLQIFVPLLIVYPIVLWIFAYKYKWNNWRHKLTGRIFAQPPTTHYGNSQPLQDTPGL